jgi:hypothetical protein
MYTTQLDNGVLNIYAVEPETYCADYPSPEQQQRYLRQGALAALLVTSLCFVSFLVS